MFQKGDSVLRNRERALKWYSLSAKQDNVEAVFNLVWMSKDTSDAPHDYKEKTQWYGRVCNRVDWFAHFYFDIWHVSLESDLEAGLWKYNSGRLEP